MYIYLWEIKISGCINILWDFVELNVICLIMVSFIIEWGNGEGGVGVGVVIFYMLNYKYIKSILIFVLIIIFKDIFKYLI